MLFVTKYAAMLITVLVAIEQFIAICGEAVDGMEGYGCPVWCVSCLLEKGNNTVQEGRKAAKRGQQKQIDRMKQ